MTDTYVDSTGETRDKATGKNVNSPADTPAQAQADPSSSGASALRQPSPMAPPDQSDIGQHEAGIATAQKPYYDKLNKVLSSPQEATAHLEKVKDAPNPQDYHKYSMEFASAMAVIGAIGGRFTRHGGTAALNAYGAALKGWQAGNVQAYEEASKQWEQNTKKTIENNNVELEKYHEILDNKKANIEQMMAGITIASSEYQNKVIFDLAKSGNFNAVAQAVDKMGAANQRLQGAFGQLNGVRNDQWAEAGAKIDLLNNDPNLNAQVRQSDPKGWFALAAAGHARGVELKQPPANDPNALPPGWTDQQLNFQADLYNKTGQIPSYGFGHDATVIRSAITKRAADRASGSGQSAGDLVSGRAEIKGLTQALGVLEKQKAAVDAFENTAVANGAVLDKLADKVDRTGVPVVERWLRAGQREVAGDTDVNNFNAQMHLYRNEVAKIMTNPNLTGVLTDTARREGEDFLGGNISAKMLHGLIPLLNADMGRRKGAISDEIASVKSQMGGTSAPPAAGGTPSEEMPEPGTIEDGFRFKGGDPSDQNNWEPAS
jgi:hypothetical protein